jgi:hypothetical protein
MLRVRRSALHAWAVLRLGACACWLYTGTRHADALSHDDEIPYDAGEDYLWAFMCYMFTIAVALTMQISSLIAVHRFKAMDYRVGKWCGVSICWCVGVSVNLSFDLHLSSHTCV